MDGKRLQKELAARIETLCKEYDRHGHVLARGTELVGGCWTDGMHANLIRIHIVYERNRIRSLCKRLHCRVPDVAQRPVPKAVRPDYVAPGNAA